jgi:hypothetical protein
MLDPNDATDLKLIFKKVQRALFNEKKRQETKQNRKFKTKKLIIESDDDDDEDDDDDDDLEEEPVLSGGSADEDEYDGMQGDDEEGDQYSESEDEEGTGAYTAGTTRRTARTVSPMAKRVSFLQEDDWDFKMVTRARSRMMDSSVVPEVSSNEWSSAESDEEDAILAEEAKRTWETVNEGTDGRSSVKLDKLAALACSLLFAEEEDDIEKANKPAAFKEGGLVGDTKQTFAGREAEKLEAIGRHWDSLDKEPASIVEDDTGAMKKPDPPAFAFASASADVAFTVIDSSKPLKKRAFHKADTAGLHSSFWTSLKPRVDDFDQHTEEHLFGTF